MKKYLPWLAGLVLLCAAFGANQVKWRWQGQCVYAVNKDGSRIELGLRDDGVVVWREITNATNSPAEQTLVITNWSGSTNIWLYRDAVPNWPYKDQIPLHGVPLPKGYIYDDLLPKFVPN